MKDKLIMSNFKLRAIPSPLTVDNLSILFLKQSRTKQLRQKVKQLLLQLQQGLARQLLIVELLFLNKFKEIFRSDLIINFFFELLKRMEPRQMVDSPNLFNLGRWLEGRLAHSSSTNLIIPGLAMHPDKLKNWFVLIPQIGEEFFHKSLTNTSRFWLRRLVLSFYYTKEKRERVAQYSFILPFILSKIEWGDSIKVEEVGNNMYLSVGLLSLVGLSCFYSLMKYIISMYLIQRYKVRDKHPLLNSIVKYYEKTGFIFVILDCIIFSVALLMLCVGGFLFYYLSKFR